MGCRQCLPLSVVQLKGKHCRKPHSRNGVVDTFGHIRAWNINHLVFFSGNQADSRRFSGGCWCTLMKRLMSEFGWWFFTRKFSYKIKHTVLFIRYLQCTSMKSKTKGKRGKKGNVVEKRKMTQVLYMSFDRFFLAVESRDLSQAEKILIRVSSFPKLSYQ